MNWCLEWEGHLSPGANNLKVDLTAGLLTLIQRSFNQRIVENHSSVHSGVSQGSPGRAQGSELPVRRN